MDHTSSLNATSLILPKPSLEADSKFICGSPEFDSLRGIFSGYNPLDSIFPTFILQLLAGIVVSRVIYLVLRPFRQSKILCSVLGGILLGPSVMGLNMKFREALFPPIEMGLLSTFSTLGVMYTLFIVSVKTDYKTLVSRAGRITWVIGFAGTFFPWITLMCLFYSYHDYLPPSLQLKFIPFFVAIILSFTFFAVVALALDELNLLTTELGQLSLSSSLISDLLQWFFVITVASFKQGNTTQAVAAFASTFIIVLICIYGIRPAFLSIIKKTPQGQAVDEFYVVLILLGASVMGFVTDFVGSSIVYGPIILGFIIPSGPPLGSILVEKAECFVMEILLPLFFIRIGYELDVSSLRNWKTSVVLMCIIFVGYFAKFLGVFVSSLSFKLRPRTAFLLGLIMNNKGIVELVIYYRWKKYGILDEETFAVMTLSSLAITTFIAPLTEKLYKPQVRLAPNNRRRCMLTIQTTPCTSQFHVITCVHNEENVNSIISLLEASNPTEISPICVYVIHLEELSGNAAPLLAPYIAKKKKIFMRTNSPISDHIFTAFENYSGNSHGPVIVRPFTMIAPYKSMHENICKIAQEKLTPLIIVPYHENQRHIYGNRVTSLIRAFNTNLQTYAPCTVGILVDRGTRQMNTCSFAYNVAVIFIGGEDDREALAYAERMSGHADVSLTILRVSLRIKKQDELDDTNKGKNKGKSKEAEKEKEEEEAMEMEMLMDDALYDEFKVKNISNACVVCREVVAESNAQVMDAIQSLEANYDLVMVGRSRYQVMELNDIEMPSSRSKNNEPLGLIGDALVSSEFYQGWLSLLVLHRCRGPS
ncbi:hypothetical protein SO802_017221 [Lithocarpus litseifolius]|uniref:Cation/H+ exchanger domain-containing protein n=1 Tax=Lithocarpus litseifolius TaxID=425828 RepID=A0AAW2D248_9ROSI